MQVLQDQNNTSQPWLISPQKQIHHTLKIMRKNVSTQILKSLNNTADNLMVFHLKFLTCRKLLFRIIPNTTFGTNIKINYPKNIRWLSPLYAVSSLLNQTIFFPTSYVDFHTPAIIHSTVMNKTGVPPSLSMWSTCSEISVFSSAILTFMCILSPPMIN